ncbi:2,5-diketo-D-gluconic acid reductase [Tetragenococcus osmophilus]|uniref:2,5-diketo-D-gluconic acid reductase n=1 Tax=Tetragenococcus osmophilus TaxID=526944 RepID=A0AA37XIM0_9ENTE|nr:aldo/keto reductase [Tetragenococcus osmophilus]GMA55239.1 2,5-diketo-D-gluconic acid reductase [Alicyclobacillus contaminans]AYW47151.1 2,5-diketo-D-gluconic acid reductase [Tetragenococcus osmophilus]GMA55333.1 2,5-diketo-D-gluconic acid reductase [Alicyclobacillus contaminans]GMA70994.1 2,5-diketo-D-gluconic acid reductase [Tetragenococcus osmophilus]GMA73396.1 2,5-diketo-D-gluconic acid reductase [Tetragenococcus osmophilus]
METVTLNNGIEMPILGFGVFQVDDADECEQAVTDALAAGYRLIDTAAAYLNEEAVGRAIEKSGIPREDLFITSKLWVQDAGYENTKKAFDVSLNKLGLDYLDLYLIHQPMNDYYGSWRAMEELYNEGKIRAIGVSNFYPDRLVDLSMNAKVVPAIDQVECHPFFQRADAIQTMQDFGVQPEAWGPFAEGQNDIFNNGILASIADKYNKTTAQVMLRWNVQRGVVVIPKSVHKNRIEENMDIWDFELSEKDMQAIATMDTGQSEIIDHFAAETAKFLNENKIHD